MTQPIAAPTFFTIFGAGGDLTWRKLVPALYNLFLDGRLPESFTVLGIDKRAMALPDFLTHLRTGIDQFSRQGKASDEQWAVFAGHLAYISADFADPATFTTLHQQVEAQAQQGQSPIVVYYLAVAPALIEAVVTGLGNANLAADRDRARIVVEKPFGHDLASAQALNRLLTGVFDERQIYRIDHYLGKETVQNILAFRFANALFEPLWDRRYIDHVEILVAEEVGVGHRGGYYDHAGALRDMIQNHLMQLLCLVAMEPPVAFAANEIRDKKVELLRAIRPITPERVAAVALRGQYEGYRQEAQVQPKSTTETFAQLSLHIDNWRWQGVPFTLRTGKNLQQKRSLITVVFRPVPHRSFPATVAANWQANHIEIHIQPNEGINIDLMAKVPGLNFQLKPVDMDFRYVDAFAEQPVPEAYETLLLDVVEGDATLFMRADQVEVAWQVVMPVLAAWSQGASDLEVYQSGSWGPAAEQTVTGGL